MGDSKRIRVVTISRPWGYMPRVEVRTEGQRREKPKRVERIRKPKER